jgi:hypothetical protein
VHVQKGNRLSLGVSCLLSWYRSDAGITSNFSCAERLFQLLYKDPVVSVNAARAARPTSAATAATSGAGNRLRRASVSLAEGSEERDRPSGLHTLAVLTLNGSIGLAHWSQGIEFPMAILTVILVYWHSSHQSFGYPA